MPWWGHGGGSGLATGGLVLLRAEGGHLEEAAGRCHACRTDPGRTRQGNAGSQVRAVGDSPRAGRTVAGSHVPQRVARTNLERRLSEGSAVRASTTVAGCADNCSQAVGPAADDGVASDANPADIVTGVEGCAANAAGSLTGVRAAHVRLTAAEHQAGGVAGEFGHRAAALDQFAGEARYGIAVFVGEGRDVVRTGCAAPIAKSAKAGHIGEIDVVRLEL